MLHNHLDLLGDVVGVELDPAHDLLEGGALLHLGFVVAGAVMGQAESQLVAGVVAQHIKDEALLDCLAHRIHMKWLGPIGVTGRLGRVGTPTKQLQGFGLWGGRKSHEGDATVLGPGCHLGGQHVIHAHFAAVIQLS